MKTWVAIAVVAVVAAACGGTGTTASSSPSAAPAASPSPTPSPTPTGFSFKLNGINTTAAGTITVTAPPGSVKVQLVIHGLQANSSHISHVHIGSCTQRGNIALALMQVIADGQGNADVTTNINGAVYPPANGTWYVVVHAGPDLGGSNATYLLCGNLFA